MKKKNIIRGFKNFVGRFCMKYTLYIAWVRILLMTTTRRLRMPRNQRSFSITISKINPKTLQLLHKHTRGFSKHCHTRWIQKTDSKFAEDKHTLHTATEQTKTLIFVSFKSYC